MEEYEEIEQVGQFKLYDRVKLKNSNITGNIVNFNDNVTCDIEYDAQYDIENLTIYTHNIEELEHE